MSVTDANGQYVRAHLDFSPEDMRAVAEALDRRLTKIQAEADDKRARDRRKALEGLK